jgi:hypothetical protein
MSDGALVLPEDTRASPVCPVLRIDLKITVCMEHLLNDTCWRKPKYGARSMSHHHNEISLNIAGMLSTFHMVNTQSVSIAKTDHLTLFREMVVACCENHSKHTIQSLMLKLLVDTRTVTAVL